MQRFILVRSEDITGVSGIGEVAEGIVFTNGMVVIRWLRKPYALGYFQTLKDVIRIHGHEGCTRVKFIDQVVIN